MLKHTPYFHKLEAAGAKFQDRGGFATINFMTSIQDEHQAVRTGVGMFDVYYQVGVEIKGPDSELLLANTLVNDVRRLRDGGVLYSSICYDNGGMLDDLTCFKFSADRYWLSPTPSRVSAVVKFMHDHLGELRATITNLGYSNAYLSIQGPRSRDVLAELSDVDLSTKKLPYFTFTTGTVAQVPQVMISRTGYSGELGYEIFFPVEYAEHVWDEVHRAGGQHNIRVCGMKTMRSLRIEKAYLLYGLDISSETDPLSAGLDWTVRFDDRNFTGREALQEISARGPSRRLRLLETNGFHPVVHGEPVLQNGHQISIVTSGDPGYTLGRTFAFAYLPPDTAAGTRFDIKLKDSTLVPANVLELAPYDPERLRLRA